MEELSGARGDEGTQGILIAGSIVLGELKTSSYNTRKQSDMLWRKKKDIYFLTVCMPAKCSGKLEKVAFLPNKLQNKASHLDPLKPLNQVF